MSFKINVKLSSRNIINDFRLAISNGLEEAAKELGKDTEPLVPNDTGELLKSFKVEKNSDYQYTASYNAPYAVYQHQGQSQDGRMVIKNRPAGGETFFMRKALVANKDKYTNIIGKNVDTVIKKGKYI